MNPFKTRAPVPKITKKYRLLARHEDGTATYQAVYPVGDGWAHETTSFGPNGQGYTRVFVLSRPDSPVIDAALWLTSPAPAPAPVQSLLLLQLPVPNLSLGLHRSAACSGCLD